MAGTSSEMTRRQSRLVISKGERGGGDKNIAWLPPFEATNGLQNYSCRRRVS